jgi:hypothetical protein
MAARMSCTVAPDANICRERFATSMHTAQSTPWGSHAITSPFSARSLTKQSWLPLWPARSQPQKHGT